MVLMISTYLLSNIQNSFIFRIDTKRLCFELNTIEHVVKTTIHRFPQMSRRNALKPDGWAHQTVQDRFSDTAVVNTEREKRPINILETSPGVPMRKLWKTNRTTNIILGSPCNNAHANPDENIGSIPTLSSRCAYAVTMATAESAKINEFRAGRRAFRFPTRQTNARITNAALKTLYFSRILGDWYFSNFGNRSPNSIITMACDYFWVFF